LDAQDVAVLIEQAADALQYAHEQQVIHLDVKPSNFLLRGNKRRPQRPTLLLADFGIARNFTTVSSSSQTIRGTPTAMAPEQWSGNPVPASDQYALAVMTYEMLAGRPPFIGSLEQLMYRHFSVQPDPPSKFNPQLSAEIDAVLLRALSKKSEERYPSISAFAADLTQAVQQSSLSVHPDTYATEQIDSQGNLSGSQGNLSKSGLSDENLGELETLIKDEASNVQGAAAESQSQGERAGLETPVLAEAVLQEVVTPQLQDSTKEQALTLSEAQTITPDTPPALSQTPVVLPVTGGQPAKKAADTEQKRAAAAEQKALAQPVQPASTGHDMPTVAVASTAATSQSTGQYQTERERPRTSTLSLVNTILLILLLLVLIGGGGAAYLLLRSSANNAQTNSLNLTATSQAQASRVTPTPTFTPTPTPVPAGMYIGDTYNGSMTNQSTYASQAISVHIIQQQHSGVIQGAISLASPHGSYTINGTVNQQGSFTFQVALPANQQPLYFAGQFQSGYLKGNYCQSAPLDYQCLTAVGYFTVGPGY
jgi:hypothetical protein